MTTVDSASDDRTVNNSVRHAYRVLSDEEKRLMVEIKDLGAAFIAKCNDISDACFVFDDGENAPYLRRDLPTRELDIARTRIEEATMWAVKALTK